jgi:hypothetical protein
MPSETINTELNDIEKLEEEIKKRQKILEKKDSAISSTNQKDMELFFGEEIAAKRREAELTAKRMEDELKAKRDELKSSQENIQKKEAEVTGRERTVAEKEQYLQGREKSLGEFEKGLGIKQSELNQKIEELRKKESETRKMQEDFKKTMSDTEVLKKELEGRKEVLRKSDDLKTVEQRIACANQDLTLKESKIARMNEELDKKKEALQAIEKELVERKIRIEDDERKLKVMKEGLETKAREFEDIFKEENEKLKHKAEEIEKYVITTSKVKSTAKESKKISAILSEPLKETKLDEEAIRKEAIARVERKLAAEKASAAPKAVIKPTPLIEQTPPKVLAPKPPVVEPVQAKEAPIAAAVAPIPAGEEDIIAQERAMMAATGSAQTEGASGCKTCEDLLKLVEKEKKIDTKIAAKTLCVGENEINNWAAELKERGGIIVHQRFMGGTDLEMTKDAIKKLGEKAEEEKITQIKKELERIREEQKRMRGGF